jgi:hypothetical protein
MTSSMDDARIYETRFRKPLNKRQLYAGIIGAVAGGNAVTDGPDQAAPAQTIFLPRISFIQYWRLRN